MMLRTKTILARLTVAEHAKIKARAGSLRMSLSAFLVAAALRECCGPAKVVSLAISAEGADAIGALMTLGMAKTEAERGVSQALAGGDTASAGELVRKVLQAKGAAQ